MLHRHGEKVSVMAVEAAAKRKQAKLEHLKEHGQVKDAIDKERQHIKTIH